MAEKETKEEVQEEVEAQVENNDTPDTETAGEQPEGQVEKSLEEQLADAQAEAAKYKDQMLRAIAESENFKKRMQREHSAALKYAGERIFKEILPVVDNLERAVNQGIVDGAGTEQNLSALKEGVELTLKSLLTTLEKFEVKPVDSLGKPFDPVNQEALTMEPNEEVPANHVADEYEKGYYYKDRLLRAAKVVVSSGSGGE